MNEIQKLQKPLQYLSHPNPEIRFLAVEALRSMGMFGDVNHSKITPVLEKAIKDKDKNVSILAVDALLDLANQRKTPTNLLICDTKVIPLREHEKYLAASRKMGDRLRPTKFASPKRMVHI